MKMKELPSQEYLNECFSYNPLSGLLKWKERPRSRFKSDKDWRMFISEYSGKYAGHKTKKGYIRVLISGMGHFNAHRLIWKLVTGEEPENQIDHRNLRRSDNTWDNLRQATNGQNQINSKASKSNKLGIKGVHYDNGRYRAVLACKPLGSFRTAEEAKAAYDKAALAKYGEFARES